LRTPSAIIRSSSTSSMRIALPFQIVRDHAF
jgi:hypothetical protein